MPEIERLTITLPADMAALIRNAVDGGDYASSSEVVREALREWKMRRTLRQHEQEELRRLWEEGLASGPGRFEDIGAVKAEARRRRAAGR